MYAHNSDSWLLAFLGHALFAIDGTGMVVNRLAAAGVWTPVINSVTRAGQIFENTPCLGKRDVILLARRRNFNYCQPPSRGLCVTPADCQSANRARVAAASLV